MEERRVRPTTDPTVARNLNVVEHKVVQLRWRLSMVVWNVDRAPNTLRELRAVEKLQLSVALVEAIFKIINYIVFKCF